MDVVHHCCNDLKDAPDSTRLTMAFIVVTILIAFGGVVWLSSV